MVTVQEVVLPEKVESTEGTKSTIKDIEQVGQNGDEIKNDTTPKIDNLISKKKNRNKGRKNKKKEKENQVKNGTKKSKNSTESMDDKTDSQQVKNGLDGKNGHESAVGKNDVEIETSDNGKSNGKEENGVNAVESVDLGEFKRQDVHVTGNGHDEPSYAELASLKTNGHDKIDASSNDDNLSTPIVDNVCENGKNVENVKSVENGSTDGTKSDIDDIKTLEKAPSTEEGFSNLIHRMSKRFKRKKRLSQDDTVDNEDNATSEEKITDVKSMGLEPKKFSKWTFGKKHAYNLTTKDAAKKSEIKEAKNVVVLDVQECKKTEVENTAVETGTTDSSVAKRGFFAWFTSSFDKKISSTIETKQEVQKVKEEDVKEEISVEKLVQEPIVEQAKSVEAKSDKKESKWYQNLFKFNWEKSSTTVQKAADSDDVIGDLNTVEIVDKSVQDENVATDCVDQLATEKPQKSTRNRFRDFFSTKSPKTPNIAAQDDTTATIDSRKRQTSSNSRSASDVDKSKRLSWSFRSLRSKRRCKNSSSQNVDVESLEIKPKKTKLSKKSRTESEKSTEKLSNGVFEENEQQSLEPELGEKKELEPRKKKWISGIFPLKKSKSDEEVEPIDKNIDPALVNTLNIKHFKRLSKKDTLYQGSVSNDSTMTLSISLSTTSCTFAFCLVKNGKKETVNVMKARGSDVGIYELRSMSCIVLDTQHQVHSIGIRAREFYSDLSLEDKNDWLFFDRLNLSLGHVVNDENVKIKSVTGQEILVSDIINLYLSELVSIGKSEIGQIDEEYSHLEIVVSCSSRWSETVIEIVKKACLNFTNTTFVPESETYLSYLKNIDIEELKKDMDGLNRSKALMNRQYSSDSLSLVDKNGLESFCDDFRDTGCYFENASPIVVVDVGIGVTCNLYKSNGESRNYYCVDARNSSVFNSIDIDARFLDLLCKMFTRQFLQDYKRTYPSGYIDLFNTFYSRKNCTNSRRVSYELTLPFTFIDHYQKVKSETIEVAVGRSAIWGVDYSNNGILKLSSKKMCSLFKVQFKNLVDWLKSVFEDEIYTDAVNVFCVGAFSNSKYLMEHLCESFDKLELHAMPGASTSVLKGALHNSSDKTVQQYLFSNCLYSIQCNDEVKGLNFQSIETNGTTFLKRCPHVEDKSKETKINIYRQDPGSQDTIQVLVVVIPSVNTEGRSISRKISFSLSQHENYALFVNVKCGDFTFKKQIN